MAKTIIQKVKFGASPKRLYETYMNAKKHAAVIGSKVSLQNKAGGSFSAFGMLKGKFLHLVKDKMIVQTWRSYKWAKSDEDSILILRFNKVKGGGQVHLIHAHVPESDYADIQKGWPSYYWKPWRKYLLAT